MIDDNKVSEIKIKIDKINMPHKIHFHKQSSKVLYYDLIQTTLSNNKLETRVVKLKEQLKKEKAMSRGWKTHVKKLEAYLMVVGAKPGNMQPIKNLLNEKEKIIQSLKEKLKIIVTDHAQTEELSILQQERDSLN